MKYIELIGEGTKMCISPSEIASVSVKESMLLIRFKGARTASVRTLSSVDEAEQFYKTIRDTLFDDKDGILGMPIKKFSDLSPRAKNVCERAGIETVGDLVSFSTEDIIKTRNAGHVTKRELLTFLHNHGLKSDYE